MSTKSFFIMMCFLLLCSNCSGKGKNGDSGNQKAIASFVEKISIMRGDIDSLKNELITLSGKAGNMSAELKELKNENEKGNMASIILPIVLIAIIILVGGSIVAFYMLIRDVTDVGQKVGALEKADKECKDSLLNLINIQDQNTRKIQELEGRTTKLEEQQRSYQLPKPQEATSNLPNKEEEVKEKREENTKEGYFENPIGKNGGTFYFQKFQDSCNDRSKFKAKITGDEGDFEPYELGRIRSYDFSSDVLEKCDSEVPLSESTAFEVKKAGKVQKKGDRWIIVRPVRVRFK